MTKPVICIGAALVDELFHAPDKIFLASTSNANVTKTAGGVARNIAHQLALLNVPVQFIGVFGDDSDGDWMKNVCLSAGVKLDAAITTKGLTGKYTGILNQDGSLFAAFITNSAHHLITPEHLENNIEVLKSGSFILADANVNVETVEWLLAFSRRTGIPFIIEPVSVPPATKLAPVNLDGLYMITPNEDELPVLCHEPLPSTKKQIEELLDRGVQNVWLHNGSNGSIIISKEKSVGLHAAVVDVVDCTGAGDGSLSGFLLGKYLGKNEEECLQLAHSLASEILQVNGAIATHLNQKKLLALVPKYFPRNEPIH
ncbi:MAG: PfkB family carbohydrate kinase [Candidatus Dadabacteria bacterium]